MLTGTCASADRYIGFSFVFSEDMQGRTETVDIYEQDGKTVAVSSLFPEYAAEISGKDMLSLSDIRTLMSVNPDILSRSIETADSMIMSWIEPRLSVRDEGAYSGDLFDSARSVRSGNGTLSDLTAHIRSNTEKNDPEDYSGTGNAVIRMIAERFMLLFGEDDPVLFIRSYDEGKYLTVDFSVQDEVRMVVSVDRSKETERHWLIIFREEGQYFFRDITARTEKGAIAFSSSLRCGSGSDSLSLPENRLLFSDIISIEAKEGQDTSFRWVLNSDTLKEPLIVSGTYDVQDKNSAYLNAGVWIGETGADLLQIGIRLEPLENAVSFEGKTYIQTEKESAGIKMAAMANLSMLAAEILPSLPNEYQEIILNLLR